MTSTPASDDVKRCTKCGEEKPLGEFSRGRSRKDGRYPQGKACVRRWHQENAEHLADYHRGWQQANRDKKKPRTAASGSVSARTPTIESEGEQTPAAVIGSGEPRTPTIGSEDEPTIAATGNEGEPEPPTHRPRQTRAD